MKPNILIIDDEPNIVEVTLTRLEAQDYQVQGYTNADRALNVLRQGNFDILLTDLKMPDKNGIDIVKEAKQIDPDLEIIMFTAHGSIKTAVEAMQAGAYDFLTKPVDPSEMIAKIEKAFEKRSLRQKVRHLEKKAQESLDHQIFAISPAMNKVLSLVRRVIHSDATVLILGESGTGKELIARMLHYESNRKDMNFVVMDCGATPPTLIESELFGYTKGAFTGALKDKLGIIEEADNGTLFLDEIGNISPELQTRLLRVLERGEFRRVGDSGLKQVNIRVIAATNADLQTKVREGTFRDDLFYRLKVITITLPPLRDRIEDIPGLSQIFINEFSAKTGKNITGIAKEALAMLKAHPWPGNIRELKNMIESAVVLCHSDIITPEDLYLSGINETATTTPPPDDNLNKIEEQEKAMVMDALVRARWVQKDAADILGISRRMMHYKIKKFNIAMEG